MTAQPMRPEDVAGDLVDNAVNAWHDTRCADMLLDDLMRHILAAVIPAIGEHLAQAIEANPANECSGAVAECARLVRNLTTGGHQ